MRLGRHASSAGSAFRFVLGLALCVQLGFYFRVRHLDESPHKIYEFRARFIL
jgi:hypothetical protein